jgi:hypothetical protein
MQGLKLCIKIDKIAVLYFVSPLLFYIYKSGLYFLIILFFILDAKVYSSFLLV